MKVCVCAFCECVFVCIREGERECACVCMIQYIIQTSLHQYYYTECGCLSSPEARPEKGDEGTDDYVSFLVRSEQEVASVHRKPQNTPRETNSGVCVCVCV